MTRWVAPAVAAAAVLVVGCGPGTSLENSLPDLQPPSPIPGVLVVHASNHLTGTQPTHCTARGQLPDPVCTPGSIRDDVDPQHLELTVCHPGWSESILPPSAEFARGKTISMLAYGVPADERSITEFDHDIPRSLGGSNDWTNLRAEVSDEPGKGIHNSKDEVEDRVHRAVCRGQVRWRDAVIVFASDWTTADRTLGLTK